MSVATCQVPCKDDLSVRKMLPSPSAVPSAAGQPGRDSGDTGQCQDAVGHQGCVENDSGMRGTYTTNVDELQCKYERGGWCTLHKAQGRKGVKVTKVWDRLKTGLFGYKVMRKVAYKCDVSVFDGNKDDFPTTAMDEFGVAVSGPSQGGHRGDFDEMKRAMKRPRVQSVCKSDSNFESKANGKRARRD